MPFFRICKNDVTDLLRQTFNASPLRVPEERVKPLVVMGQRGSKVNFRGQLKFLLEGEPELVVPFEESNMANTSLERTSSISLNFGMKILEGFLSGLGMSGAPVGAALSGAKEISFSFTNAKRVFIDPSQLGNALRGKKIDVKHPSVGIFTQPEPFEMLLVSDAIVSKSFTVNVEKANETELEASLATWQTQFADVDAKVKVDVKNNKSISFEGENYLTFAFACVKLTMDEEGNLQVGETILTKDGNKETRTYAVLDEDEFEPGMIELE
jgi:hypothetical protein